MGVVHGDQMFGSKSMRNLISRALNASLKNGKIVTYNEEIDTKCKERTELQQKLINCTKKDMQGFEVHYQPIVDPATRGWHGVEALCRWNCPEYGWVSPVVFIPEAERSGLIGIIGDWVLETAVRTCKQWNLDEHEEFVLDVNVSPMQIVDDHMVIRVLEILDQYGYSGKKLSLEITESAEFNFNNHSLNAIKRLSNAGVSVALDDFGTGYSSFNNLKKLPASILKTQKGLH